MWIPLLQIIQKMRCFLEMSAKQVYRRVTFSALCLFILTLIVIFLNEKWSGQQVVPAILDEPLIIAHRGANDRMNESTLAAYELAALDGVDYLEMDLRMTKDGRLVIMHDETIDRTTNGAGKVSDYSFEELSEFETVEVFGNQTYREPIPTLNEVLNTFKDKKKYYIETRLVDGNVAMEEKLIQLLHQYGLIEKELVIIQSFSERSLKAIQQLEPDIPLTLLFGKGRFDLQKAIHSEYPIIGMEASDVNYRRINELHRHGKQVHVFFNDLDTQRKEQQRVHSFKVDGFFTDDIVFTKELLSSSTLK